MIGGLSARAAPEASSRSSRRDRANLFHRAESKYGGSLQDHVAELAHHYARGGNPAKAAKYCLRAVRRFAELGSDAEAIAQFESGLELLQRTGR